jgi:hypothetical protein
MAVRKKIPKRSARPRHEPRASKGTEAIKAADRELLGIPKSEWTSAKRKERIVKMALRSGIETTGLCRPSIFGPYSRPDDRRA